MGGRGDRCGLDAFLIIGALVFRDASRTAAIMAGLCGHEENCCYRITH